MIVLINPNSTVSMTDAMLRTARDVAPDATFEGWTSHDGPPAIEGESDGLLAAEPLLKLVQKASARRVRAIIIGCFDDTALGDAQQLAQCPVIGIGQAAYHMACLAGGRFSVVTTLDVSVRVLEANIQRYGFAARLARVRACNVPVLSLEQDAEVAASKVAVQVIAAAQEDSVQSVVLGCGGMVDIAERVSRHTAVRLIDGVRAAAVCANLM